MENSSIIFIGMDTHKESTDVSYCGEARESAPQHYGNIPTRKLAVQKLVRHFQSKHPGATLHFCYEAGPCGYWLYRLLSSMGQLCYVVAPSPIPKKPGDRVKTDKHDSLTLTQLLKSGDLSAIYVPSEEDEAIVSRRCAQLSLPGEDLNRDATTAGGFAENRDRDGMA